MHFWRGAAAAVTVLSLAAGSVSCNPAGSEFTTSGPSFAGSPVTVGDHRLPGRVFGHDIQLAMGDRFESRFWPGVNLGSTVPGTSPGEVAAKRADYDRWIPEMKELGARVVRVYTILRPDFYDALLAYNEAHRDNPLYVIHGVWIPEEEFLKSHDLYSAAVTNEFRAEIEKTVSVVHGNVELAERPGHASGKYRSDISPWLLGWSIGVEWDPNATYDSDQKNAAVQRYSGKYFHASPASTPTESWIASMLDHLAGLESARGWSRPLTFTNWLTADPLNHPSEPSPEEDLVAVDATHIASTDQWPGGFFASYHAYPYYPDFMFLEDSYRQYRRANGAVDPYAGYLHELRSHHGDQAVMITEFGVPSAIGLAHRGALGRNQGGHSEAESLQYDAGMMDVIRTEGYAGGVVFEWMDEWFKLTWNTIEYELPPERRSLWVNMLTNEEHFGLISADPGTEPVAILDGKDNEWTARQSQGLYESEKGVSEIRATHDATYLWLRIRFENYKQWNRPGGITLAFDTRPGGNGGIPDRPGHHPEADATLHIGEDGKAEFSKAAWTDPIAYEYGVNRGYVPWTEEDLTVGSGKWIAPRLMLNRPYTVPSTGEQRRTDLDDVSVARWGTGDPKSKDFDVRNVVYGRGKVLEVRIPWAYLGFSDPSSKRVLVPHRDGSLSHEPANDKTGISVVTGSSDVTAQYGWDNWALVTWHERRKDGWADLQKAFAAAATAGMSGLPDQSPDSVPQQKGPSVRPTVGR